jgi:DNA polymerase-3 subunit delta
MIVKPAQVAAFLRAPFAEIGAVLLYGPNRGLVQERSAKLLEVKCGTPIDPLACVELTVAALKSDPTRLADEAAALTFSGRQNVVRIREATDSIGPLVAAWLTTAPAGAFVVIEAGELAKVSPLRKACEGSRNAAVLPCYPDEEEVLECFIIETLSGSGLDVSPEALAFLSLHIGADRALARRELEKLAVYKERGVLAFADVEACIGDSGAVSAEMIAFVACDGDAPSLDTALERLFSEGAAVVEALRSVARHLQRLLVAGALIASGQSAERAMAQLRPPVFYKHHERFRRQLQLWPMDRLVSALAIVTQAELECKTTGMPAPAVCHRALMRIARAAARAR